MVAAAMFPLTLKAATVRRKGTVLLGPVDHAMHQGGLTAIIGPNGAGKTTLLRVMHGVERLSGGSATWAVTAREAQARQSYVFQQPVMLRRSVAENLAYPLRLQKAGPAARRKAVDHWAARIGMADRLQMQATRLSGGERQKVALARALIRAPDVLFLDEPCANLDGPATRDIEALLRETLAAGTTIVLVTHDMGQVRRLATEVIFMMKGKIAEVGPAEENCAAPKTRELAAFLRGEIIV